MIPIPQFSPKNSLAGVVAGLFQNNEPGVWYDPSDFSTMFQDAAGTTPVTAVEQPVGLVLDKSGNGNHAYQTTSTSRPVLSARVNLLTKTEQFNDAAWNKVSGGTGIVPVVTPNATVAPDGTATACQIVFNKGAGTTASDYSIIQYFTSSVIGVGSIYIKADAPVRLMMRIGSTWLTIDATTVWKRVNTVSESGASLQIGLREGYGLSDIPNTATVYIWGASIVPADQSDLPYQRVNTSTDYDTVGFKPYLKFDGVDDWLVTNTITPGTDKAQVFAGVRKLSDAAQAAMVELSASAAANNGAFLLAAPDAATATFAFDSKGTLQVDAVASGQTAPKTAVVVGLGDIAGDSAAIRVNGTVLDSDTADQGTGNYLAYPLYIGRRGGTTLPFNGYIYSLIARFGANLPADTIASTESWVNWKTGALDWREVTDAASFRWNSATASPDAE